MPDQPTVFRLHYRGIRFREARLPVEVLSDLPAFRDLLVSYARDEWRLRYPDRVRVPKGFERSLAFDLVTIEDGSAIPNLEWNRDSAQANLPGFADEIEEILEASYEDVVSLIEGRNGRFTILNAEKVRALNKFGAGLRDDETIELAHHAGGGVVYFNALRRKELITGARETYIIRVEGTGELIGIYVPRSNPSHIVVRTAQYGSISIPLDDDQIKEDFANGLNSIVQFDLSIELDSQDRFRGVSDVYEVAIVFDQERAAFEKAMNRLSELRSLPRGWYDGEGEAISGTSLENATTLIEKRPSLSNVCRIFPKEDGSILIDFEANKWEYSIEINSDGSLEMYGIEVEGDAEMEPHSFDSVDALVADLEKRMNVNG